VGWVIGFEPVNKWYVYGNYDFRLVVIGSALIPINLNGSGSKKSRSTRIRLIDMSILLISLYMSWMRQLKESQQELGLQSSVHGYSLNKCHFERKLVSRLSLDQSLSSYQNDLQRSRSPLELIYEQEMQSFSNRLKPRASLPPKGQRRKELLAGVPKGAAVLTCVNHPKFDL